MCNVICMWVEFCDYVETYDDRLIYDWQNYRYAGVQYGGGCDCGNHYGRYGYANNCNMRCQGNFLENCGGVYANWILQRKNPHKYIFNVQQLLRPKFWTFQTFCRFRFCYDALEKIIVRGYVSSFETCDEMVLPHFSKKSWTDPGPRLTVILEIVSIFVISQILETIIVQLYSLLSHHLKHDLDGYCESIEKRDKHWRISSI